MRKVEIVNRRGQRTKVNRRLAEALVSTGKFTYAEQPAPAPAPAPVPPPTRAVEVQNQFPDRFSGVAELAAPPDLYETLSYHELRSLVAERNLEPASRSREDLLAALRNPEPTEPEPEPTQTYLRRDMRAED